MNIGLLLQSNKLEGISIAIAELAKKIKDSEGLAIIVPGCGEVLRLNHIDDLPPEDTPCPCGDPEHWLVKYSITGGEESEQARPA